MALLITPAEVAAHAFHGSLDPEGGFVPESTILSAQQKFLKPVLNGLYDALAAYPTLLNDYLKPALAQYVRYLLLPSIAAQVGSVWVISPHGDNFGAASQASVAALRKRSKADAVALMRRAVEHMEADRALYPEYDPARNVMNRVSADGGVVL